MDVLEGDNRRRGIMTDEGIIYELYGTCCFWVWSVTRSIRGDMGLSARHVRRIASPRAEV